ncbi:MAG: type II secretion system protein M [Gammaproteobacteria bacterium]|nr:type II secretion system protein M [Gammaproteobacteria bacterium]
MNVWWQGLNPRERLLVSLASAAALVALLFLLVVEPLQLRHGRLQDELAGQARALQSLQRLGEEAAALREGGAPRGRLAEGQTLLALLNASAGARGLSSGIERIVPNGSGEASVVVRGVPFDTLVAWLIALRTASGVEAQRLVVDSDGSAPGRINASLTLVATSAP